MSHNKCKDDHMKFRLLRVGHTVLRLEDRTFRVELEHCRKKIATSPKLIYRFPRVNELSDVDTA